jgi:hypothetical protein
MVEVPQSITDMEAFAPYGERLSTKDDERELRARSPGGAAGVGAQHPDG